MVGNGLAGSPWRTVRSGLFAGAFALAVIAGGSAARSAAQEATPAIDDPVLAALVAEYNAAWSSDNPSQVSALYTEDAVFEELVLGGVVTANHEELEAFADAAFGAFTDLAITVTDGFMAGDLVAIEWELTGSYTGTFGTLPQGTGQAVAVPGASILELDNGLIAHQREYWDVAMLLSQVGALPAES